MRRAIVHIRILHIILCKELWTIYMIYMYVHIWLKLPGNSFFVKKICSDLGVHFLRELSFSWGLDPPICDWQSSIWAFCRSFKANIKKKKFWLPRPLLEHNKSLSYRPSQNNLPSPTNGRPAPLWNLDIWEITLWHRIHFCNFLWNVWYSHFGSMEMHCTVKHNVLWHFFPFHFTD